jgi:hypothetical protein
MSDNSWLLVPAIGAFAGATVGVLTFQPLPKDYSRTINDDDPDSKVVTYTKSQRLVEDINSLTFRVFGGALMGVLMSPFLFVTAPFTIPYFAYTYSTKHYS